MERGVTFGKNRELFVIVFSRWVSVEKLRENEELCWKILCSKCWKISFSYFSYSLFAKWWHKRKSLF